MRRINDHGVDRRVREIRSEIGPGRARVGGFPDVAGASGKSHDGHVGGCASRIGGSMATLETGNWLGLMLPWGPLLVTSLKLGIPFVALIVTQTRPPAGEEAVSGPMPLVVA